MRRSRPNQPCPQKRGHSKRLGTVGFTEPFYDTFAWVSRRGAALSPAARAVIAAAERVGPLTGA